VRPRAPRVGDPQDGTTNHQHHGHEADLPDVLLDDVVEQEGRHRGRDRRRGQEPREPPVRVIAERAVPERGEPGGDEPPPVVAEVDEEGGQRPAVQHDGERERLQERVRPPEQPRDEDQVSGRRDRQELRESLHDPHHEGLEELLHGTASGGRSQRPTARMDLS
jgi:hypothetical protein